MNTNLHFSEQLFSMRAAAGAIYDRAFATGIKQEEIGKTLAPLVKALEKLVEKGAQTDLPGCVIAIQRLETLAQAHENDAKYLLEKAHNSRHHAESIKAALMKELKAEGVSEKHIGDFTLTIIRSKEGRESLVVR